MQRIREFLERSPWAGWAFAGLLLIASVFIYIRRSGGTSPYSPERMQETVTIKFADTGEEIEMTRGELDRDIRRRGDKVDGTVGIINPKTNLPTGFLFNKGEWDAMVARINAEKEQVRKETGRTIAPAPRSNAAPPVLPESAPPDKPK